VWSVSVGSPSVVAEREDAGGARSSPGPGPDAAELGFVHLGVLHSDPEELVAAVLPHLRDALDAGSVVTTVVDRRTQRSLREALGDDARALTFRAPAEVLRPDAERLVAELRGLGARHRPRRCFVLAQYQGFTTGEDAAFWEAACGLVLDDLPLTLVCACPRDADPAALESALAGHAQLLVGGGRHRNPRWRTPVDRSATPVSLWGPRAVRMVLRDAGDLGKAGDRVRRAAHGAGMDPDDAARAARVVQEAALAAQGEGDGACTLEVRTLQRSLLAEITAEGAGVAGEQTELIPRALGEHLVVRSSRGQRSLRLLVGRRADGGGRDA
jgi:DcmR-like sensory protein